MAPESRCGDGEHFHNNTRNHDDIGADDTRADDTRALVERARDHDEEAWAALYRAVYPRLLAYARRRLFDGDGAKDAVAETMARAVAGIDRFAWKGGGFDAWLFGILRHVVLDTQRARRLHHLKDADHSPSGDAGPLEQVLADEEVGQVRVAFDLLGPGDREVLELRVLAGLSSEEVATVLGKRPGAVRMAQSRALERLRQSLEKS
ncbi:MAG: RNA polymerase subunit sigma [Acidimicrobiales bacterium]|nr:MAG: RNA polymerase subunit sigma [Acidimicrobiales bacterium]